MEEMAQENQELKDKVTNHVSKEKQRIEVHGGRDGLGEPIIKGQGSQA